MDTVDEKRKTIANDNAEVKDARVIANYGDPGLQEDYHFDILSRYIIVMFESCDRIPTIDKWWKMFAVVRRPQQLWINAQGGVAASPSSQQRSDALGNINVGYAANYSVNGIAPINQPYTLGERIKIKKISNPQTTSDTNPTFFQSAFTVWTPSTSQYGSWYNQGATLPYFLNNSQLVYGLYNQTIQPINNNGLFSMFLSKSQYESFILTINQNANQLTIQNLQSIFDGSWGGFTQVYDANGGYLFGNGLTFQTLNMVEYDDINIGNKSRIATSQCIPLVVTTPDSFPTPSVRSVGTINYTPTYATIKNSN